MTEMHSPQQSETRSLVDPNMPSYQSLLRTTSLVQGKKVSFVTSIFNLSNAILGAGILGLPYACSRSGVILFSVLLIAIAIVADYSLFLLLWCARVTNKYTYEELGIQAFGQRGPYLVGAAILVQNLGQMVSYLVVVGDLLPEVMKLLLGSDSHSVFVQRKVLHFNDRNNNFSSLSLRQMPFEPNSKSASKCNQTT
eukprot:c9875_g1_i2.p1 GENE.c9875_g1_i2~~c9875_g1_i2.p1  ORF type:complete len:196 (-),score=24.86 c9875_g1_i2:47-634(-)